MLAVYCGDWTCASQVSSSYLGRFMATVIEVFHDFLHANQTKDRTINWDRLLGQGCTDPRRVDDQASGNYCDAQWCQHNYFLYLKKFLLIHMHRAKGPGKTEVRCSLQNYRFLVLNWLYDPLLAPRIWRWFLDFCKIL